jgi:hypothetical protein
MMMKTRAEQVAKEPYIHQAHLDTETVIYDYVTGLPIIEEQTVNKLPKPRQQDEPGISAHLPAPGESIDDPPTSPESQAQAVIRVEVG